MFLRAGDFERGGRDVKWEGKSGNVIVLRQGRNGLKAGKE
jgi:hypothetical protein